jgi:hypothetical protein
VALVFWRFLLHLAVRHRRLFAVAAVLYVSGSVGVEMVSAYHADLHGVQNLTYELITVVEEALEMLGVLVFVYALLDYLRAADTELRLLVR